MSKTTYPDYSHIDVDNVTEYRIRRQSNNYPHSTPTIDVWDNSLKRWIDTFSHDETFWKDHDQGKCIPENRDILPPEMSYRVDDEGIVYITHSSCCVGDYGGAGSIGRANINYLEEEYPEDTWLVFGSHSSEEAYIPDTPEYRELLESLNEYPVFDDETISQVESNWESVAWDSWLKSDLLHTLPEILQEYVDTWTTGYPDGESKGDPLWNVYRESMEETNTYPTPEYNGVHVSIDRIKDDFCERITAIALDDKEWIVSQLTEAGCPVREADQDSIRVACDWSEEYGNDHPIFEILREYLSKIS